ncbi:MAG: heparan-alpha-glucosaminide N-acetyltransferase domain-containing protein, partial [Anaerolineae bacterium]|nr:heparan-alpha-glucosaminide N-acetyltransferase domain-containing protein [Anaerolineae bacterium]
MLHSVSPVSASLPIVAFPSTHAHRLKSIDMLRGVAMLLMALDHCSVAAHVNLTAESYDGVRPQLDSWPYVLTGLLTNLASGIFFALTGVSVAFFETSRRKRGWSEWQITRFLFIRAGILLVLDQFVNRFGWYVGLMTFDVLSALAFALVVISLARHLPLRVLALASLGLFLVYPLLVQWFPYNPAQPFSAIAAVLLQHQLASAPAVEFPFLGRLALVLAGYVCGRLLQMGRITLVPRRLFQIALAGYAIWLVLRLLDGYGNFLPYQSGWPWYYFFIENKEPPSITFLL